MSTEDGGPFDHVQVQYLKGLLTPVRERYAHRCKAIESLKQQVLDKNHSNLFINSSCWEEYSKLRDEAMMDKTMVDLRSKCGLLSGLGRHPDKLSQGCLLPPDEAEKDSQETNAHLDKLIYPTTQDEYKDLHKIPTLHMQQQKLDAEAKQCDLLRPAVLGDVEYSNANFMICSECYKSKTIPDGALINDTWQGVIPPELRMFTSDFEDAAVKDAELGLTTIELSMICLYNPITFLKMLPAGE